MKTPFAIMIAVAALGCGDPGAVEDLEENEALLELESLEPDDEHPTGPGEDFKIVPRAEALVCGSKSGVVGGYSTKCSCGDYTLACSATQSVNYGLTCQNPNTACTYIEQRSGTWQSTYVFNASSVWSGYYWNCGYNVYC
jgi:hypothetical protein